MKPVTLYDVADHAGVSYQTVSRVVNQASHVSAKTRQKVEAAMAELNYIPNRVAQQLAGKQTPLIGVATANLALHAPSQIVAAIKSRADQSGASVVIAMVERSGVDACKAAVHNLLSQRVTGLIINYPLDEDDAIAVAAACGTVPVLFLDVSDQSPVNSVIFSHDDGARLGVEHWSSTGISVSPCWPDRAAQSRRGYGMRAGISIWRTISSNPSRNWKATGAQCPALHKPCRC